MKTPENIMAAFAGESHANRKYLAFAEDAEKDGFVGKARLFRAAAEGETIHALKHLKNSGKIGTTQQNVKAALEGETYEFTFMYPEFLAVAQDEGQKDAYKSFYLANEAEKSHAELYQKALDSLAGGTDYQANSVYLCPVCGYLSENNAPERCPVCGAAGSLFKKF